MDNDRLTVGFTVNYLDKQTRTYYILVNYDFFNKQIRPYCTYMNHDFFFFPTSQRKRSAHERARAMVASGEWSSGKRWADDAPKEQVEADSVSVINTGACGAFVHGLEDEFLGEV